MKTRRCALSIVLLILVCTPPGLATWSIVAANLETGEIGLASATCLANYDLKNNLGVVVVGKGAGQIQAAGDLDNNRGKMFTRLKQGKTAVFIKELILATDDRVAQEQFGIVDRLGFGVTFSGDNTSRAWEVAGRVGNLTYAIQGNAMEGAPVIFDAERALLETPGDVGTKVMAAMEAARDAGGDRRCHSWGKTAHTGYLLVSRIGDTTAGNAGTGYAAGSYYMVLEFRGGVNAVDPVIRLREFFDDFRDSQVGYADHLQSTKQMEPRVLLPDGASTASLRITLRDLTGERVRRGGATLTVVHRGVSDRATTIGSTIDHGDGTYTVPLQAGTVAGRDEFKVTVDDGQGVRVLYPHPVLEVHNLTVAAEGHGDDGISLELHGGQGLAGRAYLLLGTSSGTHPGFQLLGQQVPLNPDLLSVALYQLRLPGIGNLDAHGHDRVDLSSSALDWNALSGRELAFSWITLEPVDFASEPLQLVVDG
jgi:uncharacterized Ntn-hydrolase superfamily protein